ncbi:hypothetical protein BH11ACT2_BH11ACT2_19120 [soil metagenome]
MIFFSVASLLLALGAIAYLVYALVRPERF